MPGTTEALGVMLLLLPGFSCAYLVQHLTVRPKQTELDKVIEALLLSFFLYLAVSPFFGYSLPASWQKRIEGGVERSTLQFNWPYLAALAGLVLAVGILYSANLNHDWLLHRNLILHHRFLDFLWDQTIWHLFLRALSQSDGINPVVNRLLGHVPRRDRTISW